LDGEGEVVATSDVRPSLGQVEAVLPSLTGPIEQVPPAYSALKIDGKAAYARARAGEEVEMKVRRVTVHSLTLRHPELVSGSIPPPAVASPEWMLKQVQHDGLNEATLAGHVSKGTYIRSLARDIARTLGTVGHVTMLRRTRAGPFTLSQAISLDKLEELAKARQLEQTLLPLTAGLDDIPALPVTPDQARLLRQGRKLTGIAAQPGLHLATEGSVPVALVELFEGELRVVRGFNF
ncbi:MAG TPA: tRNA pseudouridine(55) synthase TruB, partial [Allosphingosinicella sp.]|nr:tRNA pseudouridine(55) synthase TruB [Allosphingosinicella sp.]